MAKRDCYDVLGIQEGFKRRYKKAYRKLATKYHPDKISDKVSEEKFKEASITIFYLMIKERPIMISLVTQLLKVEEVEVSKVLAVLTVLHFLTYLRISLGTLVEVLLEELITGEMI